MMKLLMFAQAFLLLSASLFAAGANPEMVKIGGEGKFVIVNATDLDDKVFEGATQRLAGFLMINTEIQKGSWNLADAKKLFRETKGNAVVFVVKDANLPPSLIAMEEKWGVANVEGLSEKAAMREALRVATVVLGAAASKYQTSVMLPAFSREDLEKNIGNILTVDTIMAIYPNLGKLGFKQFDMVEYAEALEEGIAPAPVNDAQRKLKAEFDKKKKGK